MDEELKITQLSSGDKAHELAEKMYLLIEKYSPILTGYELMGVLDVVKVTAHRTFLEGKDGV